MIKSLGSWGPVYPRSLVATKNPKLRPAMLAAQILEDIKGQLPLEEYRERLQFLTLDIEIARVELALDAAFPLNQDRPTPVYPLKRKSWRN